MKRYRCSNCGTSFLAETPACAVCEIDPATDPRAVGVVQPVATIHYDPPHPKIRHRGMGYRACDPKTHIGKGRGSGEPAAVNCEACQATPAFQAAVKRGELDFHIRAEDDEEIVPPLPAQGVVDTGKGDCGCH